MKRLLTILCLLILTSCSEEPEILQGPFLIKEGIKYDQKTDKPITGAVIELYESNQYRFKHNYKKCK